MDRPDLHQYGIHLAITASLRATCRRAKVGAAILGPGGRVISTGYNGSHPGTNHCIDDGCVMLDGHCIRCMHAELNALRLLSDEDKAMIRASKVGVVMYTTHAPCPYCCHLARASGIMEINYLIPYGVTDEQNYRAEISRGPGVLVTKVPGPPGGWDLQRASGLDPRVRESCALRG